MDESVQDRPSAKRYCRKCLYELTGLPQNRCPECGVEFDPNDPTSYLPGRNWFDILPWDHKPRIPAALLAVACALSVVFVAWMIIDSVDSLSQRPPGFLATLCRSHLNTLRTTISSCDPNDGKYPRDLEAVTNAQSITVESVQCPDYRGNSSELGYCYVTGLSPDDPDDWIILFDASCGIIQGTDGPGPHNDICNVAYVKKRSRGLSVNDFRKEFARFHANFVKARGHPPAIPMSAPGGKGQPVVSPAHPSPERKRAGPTPYHGGAALGRGTQRREPS